MPEYSVVDACQLLSGSLCFVAKRYIEHAANVSEEVNRKCRLGNTSVQLSIPYTDPEHHNARRHKRTASQTDAVHLERQPIADHTACSTIG